MKKGTKETITAIGITGIIAIGIIDKAMDRMNKILNGYNKLVVKKKEIKNKN